MSVDAVVFVPFVVRLLVASFLNSCVQTMALLHAASLMGRSTDDSAKRGERED